MGEGDPGFQHESIPQIEKIDEPTKLLALVIDDDNTGKIIARRLNNEQTGFRFEYFKSSTEAYEKIAELLEHRKQIPALILLDFNLGLDKETMARGTGFIKKLNELIEGLNVQKPQIIGISSQTSKGLDEQGRKSGGQLLIEAGARENIPKHDIATNPEIREKLLIKLKAIRESIG